MFFLRVFAVAIIGLTGSGNLTASAQSDSAKPSRCNVQSQPEGVSQP